MGNNRGKDKPYDSWYEIPRKVHRCADYRCLSGSAVKLLNALAFQFRGKNNGDLTAAWSVMQAQHGFKSKQPLNDALLELMAANLIMRTRQGGRGRCSLYAITWLSIDECVGKMLDVQATALPPRRVWNQKDRTPLTPEARKLEATKLKRKQKANLKNKPERKAAA